MNERNCLFIKVIKKRFLLCGFLLKGCLSLHKIYLIMEYVWTAIAFVTGLIVSVLWFQQKRKSDKLIQEAGFRQGMDELKDNIAALENERSIMEAKEVALREELQTLNTKLEFEIKQKSEAEIEIARLQTKQNSLLEKTEELEGLRQDFQKEQTKRIDAEKKQPLYLPNSKACDKYSKRRKSG